MHIEFLVEEASCAALLRVLVPKLLGNAVEFNLHVFQGKQALLASLPSRMKGYARWLPPDWRIVVLVDRDNDDCVSLKRKLNEAAAEAGLVTRTQCATGRRFQVLNRIAVEELEAWFFGDVAAITAAYQRVPASLAARRGFRDPDAIAGGTWEKLEQVLQTAGYYKAGIPKIEVARMISPHLDPIRNRSRSFKTFCDALKDMAGRS